MVDSNSRETRVGTRVDKGNRRRLETARFRRVKPQAEEGNRGGDDVGSRGRRGGRSEDAPRRVRREQRATRRPRRPVVGSRRDGTRPGNRRGRSALEPVTSRVRRRDGTERADSASRPRVSTRAERGADEGDRRAAVDSDDGGLRGEFVDVLDVREPAAETLGSVHSHRPEMTPRGRLNDDQSGGHRVRRGHRAAKLDERGGERGELLADDVHGGSAAERARKGNHRRHLRLRRLVLVSLLDPRELVRERCLAPPVDIPKSGRHGHDGGALVPRGGDALDGTGIHRGRGDGTDGAHPAVENASPERTLNRQRRPARRVHDARRHRIDPRRLHVRKRKVGKYLDGGVAGCVAVAETRRAKVINRRRLHHHEGGRHEVSHDGDVAEPHRVGRVPRQVRSKHRESSPAVRGSRRGRRGRHHR
mmetsp:Transcript_14765/g.60272  ORF Transcript_14765/g.60272 Transcript_14765/m.60272 type:complete len:419 (-) Transcript_14765:1820-3076(-)